MSKYHKTIKGVTIDIYDVLRAFEVTSPPIQHAVKKLLMPGNRGHKDQLQDVQEALQSIQREIEYLTIDSQQKDITAGQALMRYKEGDWIICQHFKPKNNDGKVDVMTYKHRQVFANQEIEKWEFDDISQNNSVYAWRPTAEKEVVFSWLDKSEPIGRWPAIDVDGWIKHDGTGRHIDGNKLVEVKFYNGRKGKGIARSFGWYFSTRKSERDWCIEFYRELTNEQA